jgi:hypothetical protein
VARSGPEPGRTSELSAAQVRYLVTLGKDSAILQYLLDGLSTPMGPCTVNFKARSGYQFAAGSYNV